MQKKKDAIFVVQHGNECDRPYCVAAQLVDRCCCCRDDGDGEDTLPVSARVPETFGEGVAVDL